MSIFSNDNEIYIFLLTGNGLQVQLISPNLVMSDSDVITFMYIYTQNSPC